MCNNVVNLDILTVMPTCLNYLPFWFFQISAEKILLKFVGRSRFHAYFSYQRIDIRFGATKTHDGKTTHQAHHFTSMLFWVVVFTIILPNTSNIAKDPPQFHSAQVKGQSQRQNQSKSNHHLCEEDWRWCIGGIHYDEYRLYLILLFLKTKREAR